MGNEFFNSLKPARRSRLFITAAHWIPEWKSASCDVDHRTVLCGMPHYRLYVSDGYVSSTIQIVHLESQARKFICKIPDHRIWGPFATVHHVENGCAATDVCDVHPEQQGIILRASAEKIAHGICTLGDGSFVVGV